MLKYLSREYGICDEDLKIIFLTISLGRDKKIAVEENGVTYHHPQIIGVENIKNS